MLDFDKNTDCSLCSDKCIAQFIDMEDIPILNRNKTVVHYSAGQVITKQSSFSSKIIYISSGLVKTMKEGRNGKNTIIQVIGENSFLTIPIHESQKKYTITSIALTDAKICEINEPGIHEIISKSQKFSDYILDSYFEDQIYLTNRLHILNTRNNHGKLASSLLYLNDFNKNGFSIFEHLTRKIWLNYHQYL